MTKERRLLKALPKTGSFGCYSGAVGVGVGHRRGSNRLWFRRLADWLRLKARLPREGRPLISAPWTWGFGAVASLT